MAVPQSLPVRLYLLAYDVDRQKLTDRTKLGYLLQAAVLTDLALRGALTDDKGRATVAAGDTGDPVLDGVLGEIRADKPRKWKTWISRRTKDTSNALQAQLADVGVIRWERRTVLGIFPADRMVVADPTEVERQRALAREAIVGETPVERISQQDAATAALAATASMRFVLTGKEARQRKKRVEALTERSGAAVPALRKVFQEIQAAVTVAAASAASSGSS